MTPDGDHLGDALEAWFGLNPTEFNGGISQLSTNGTVSTFQHPQNVTLPVGLNGFYEWSLNLVDWYAGNGVDGPIDGPTVTIAPTTVGATTTTTATASQALGNLFLRVGVTVD